MFKEQTRITRPSINQVRELYHITQWGLVISKKSNKALKHQIDPDKYPYVCILYKRKIFRFTIHRLIALIYIPNPDNKPCVNHINGIKSDFSISNLEWCTIEENNKHALDFQVTWTTSQYFDHKRNSNPIYRYLKHKFF